MTESTVSFDGPGGALAAFVAEPDDGAVAPAVVVVQEWWGLNEQIRGVARRLAGAGFRAVVPDLYRGRQTDEPDEARKLLMELDRPQAVEELRGILGSLLEQGAPTVGAMGFCMGGGITWELARTDDRLGAAVPCYGAVDFGEGGPALVPFQAHYGTEDRFPDEMYEQIEARAAETPGSELHRYPGAGHAFMNEERPSYRRDAAELAWQRAIEFLRARLV